MDNNADGEAQQEEKRDPHFRLGSSLLIWIGTRHHPQSKLTERREKIWMPSETPFYSKHWLFSTLTRLIQMVTEHSEENSEAQMQLSDDEEEDLCRVWDMAMDKDVAGFLQEFKAADILLGVIAKSHCPRLTEICVGILGNIACFPDTCATLSQNEGLGGCAAASSGRCRSPDPSRNHQTAADLFVSKDLCSLWLQRIRQQTSVCFNLCFIMSSSTNMDLLEKVGELVDKLFDLDEELMKCWLTAQPSEREEADGEIKPDLCSSLLEAAKQLRSESPNGLEVYLHILQLLTTVEEGIEVFAAPDGPGKPVWEFVSDVLCEDLCQPNDLPVVLHEQKSVLIQALSVLQALYSCQDRWRGKNDTSLSLIGSVFRVCLHQSEFKRQVSDKDEANDDQLQTLEEVTSEFLADLCNNIQKDTVADLIKKDYLTHKTCQAAAACLLPNYKTSVQHLQAALSETDPQLADVMRTQFPV